MSRFLFTANRYQAPVRRVADSATLPSHFASCNAPACTDVACQVCSFVKRTEELVVHRTSQDSLASVTMFPFTSRTSWLAIPAECSYLCRTRAHLQQGTRPSKKPTNIQYVKRSYLNTTSIAKARLLVIPRNEPLAPCRECIVVPRPVLDGSLTALQLKRGHPSKHQLKLLVPRYFFALDTGKCIGRVCDGCNQCVVLLQTPHSLIEPSTNDRC